MIIMSIGFKYGIGHLTPELALQIANGEVSGILTEDVKSKL